MCVNVFTRYSKQPKKEEVNVCVCVGVLGGSWRPASTSKKSPCVGEGERKDRAGGNSVTHSASVPEKKREGVQLLLLLLLHLLSSLMPASSG